MTKNKTIALTLLLSTACLAMESEEKELQQAFGQSFGQLVVYKADTDRDGSWTPTPPPKTPTTPTTWDGLETTLMTDPYYVRYALHFDQTIPLFVSRLKGIEDVETNQLKALDKQLKFIGETWLTWNLWPSNGPYNPIRYPLIYKFLVNRSTQTTHKGWLAWLGCFK